MIKNIRFFFIVGLILVGIASYVTFRSPVQAKGKRYAITLVNERVYYGKLVRVTNDTVELTSVYTVLSQSSDKKSLTLIRVGEGTYNTDGSMTFNKQNVLFFSPIRENSKINEVITEYETQQTASPKPSVSPSNTPTSPQP